MSHDYQATVEKFIDIANEADDTRRRALIDALFTEDAEYCDPDAQLVGRDAIDAYLGRLSKNFPPGLSFALTAKVNGHHDQARFSWQFGRPGAAVASGTDVIILEGERVKRLHAFFN
jgi:hypothetical protein